MNNALIIVRFVRQSSPKSQEKEKSNERKKHDKINEWNSAVEQKKSRQKKRTL